MRPRTPSWQIHLALLWAWAVLFTFLPSWLTGIPARHLLSSDAEYYAAVAQHLAGPISTAADTALAPDLLPETERIFLVALVMLARAVGADLLDAWVVYELFAAVLFATALYWLLVDVTRSRTASVAATLVASLGVHALGGSIFGFEPRGFIPRDLALGVAILLVLAYVRAKTDRQKAAVFLGCGVAANAYSVLFAHLAGVLLLTELVRRRHIAPIIAGFGLLAAIGALPTIIDVLATRVTTAPPDPIVYELRARYVLVTPLLPALVQYLRRPLLALAAIVLVYVLCRSQWTAEERARLIPFFAIGATAAAVAAVGVILEQGTPLARLLASRASLFLILASMPVCLVGAHIALRGRIRRLRHVGFSLAMAFFVAQSNILTDIRSVTKAVVEREQRADLLRVAAELRTQTSAGDTFIAPSSDSEDLAASLRTYADRPAFATYKDLGIVFYDGKRARDLYGRWLESEAALQADRVVLLEFMARHGVRAAVVRSGTRLEVVLR